jgi:hypothetical protein
MDSALFIICVTSKIKSTKIEIDTNNSIKEKAVYVLDDRPLLATLWFITTVLFPKQ